MPDIFGITCIFSSLATSCPVWKISTHYAGRLPTLMRRTRADAPNPCWCTDANLLHRQTGFLQDCAELWIQLLQIYCVCIRKNILLTLMASRKISLNFFDQLGKICWHFFSNLENFVDLLGLFGHSLDVFGTIQVRHHSLVGWNTAALMRRDRHKPYYARHPQDFQHNHTTLPDILSITCHFPHLASCLHWSAEIAYNCFVMYSSLLSSCPENFLWYVPKIWHMALSWMARQTFGSIHS